jgi:hypothetical protein
MDSKPAEYRPDDCSRTERFTHGDASPIPTRSVSKDAAERRVPVRLEPARQRHSQLRPWGRLPQHLVGIINLARPAYPVPSRLGQEHGSVRDRSGLEPDAHGLLTEFDAGPGTDRYRTGRRFGVRPARRHSGVQENMSYDTAWVFRSRRLRQRPLDG